MYLFILLLLRICSATFVDRLKHLVLFIVFWCAGIKLQHAHYIFLISYVAVFYSSVCRSLFRCSAARRLLLVVFGFCVSESECCLFQCLRKNTYAKFCFLQHQIFSRFFAKRLLSFFFGVLIVLTFYRNYAFQCSI